MTRLLKRAFKAHRLSAFTTRTGREIARIPQDEVATLLADFVDTNFPTERKCERCGKVLTQYKKRWCSDRCQERNTKKS